MANLKFPQRQASIQMFGRLTRDAELKYTPDNRAVCEFSIAVDRWNSKSKEREAWFAKCGLFGPQAEKFAEVAVKGRGVYVTGEPYIEKYTGRDGAEKQVFKVYCQTADTLEWPDDGGNGGQSRPAQAQAQAHAQGAQRAASAPRQATIPEPIPEDDIPF